MVESSGDSVLLTLELPFPLVDWERPWPNPKLAVPRRTTRTAVSVVHLPVVLAVRLRSFRLVAFIFHSPQRRQPTPGGLVAIPVAGRTPSRGFPLTDSFD